MTAGSWLDYSHGMWTHVWQIGRNMFLPDSDTLFYALQFKKMMLFPCVNLMSFYAFGNQAVKPCCKHFPRVCLSVIFYVYAKGCLLQAKS